MTLDTVWRDPVYIGAALVGTVLGMIVGSVPVAAVGLILTAIVVFVLTRPDLVLLAMIAALPWENMLHYPSAQLSTVKGIGAAVMVAYLLRLCGDRRTVIRLPPLVGLVAGLGVWIGITFIFSSNPSEGMQTLARWGLFLAFFFLIVQIVDGRREVIRALKCFTISAAVAAGYTLWLFLGTHSGYRAAGPLEDPNDLAYLMACTIPISAFLFQSEPRRRVLWATAFVLITAAMLATFSRGALVGIAALVVWGIVTRRIAFRAVAAGLFTALVAVVLAFTVWKSFVDVALHQKQHIAHSNIESREARWSAALQLTAKNPLTGVGPGLYPRAALPILRDGSGELPRVTVPQTVAHNTYLEILAENGIPGLLLFFAYLATVWSLLRRVQRHAALVGDVEERWLATALQASCIIAIVSATFLSEELTAPFWLLGGLAVVLTRDLGRSPEQQTTEPALGPAHAILAPST